MTIADHITRFWQEDSIKPFSPNETRLYFFLLSRWINQTPDEPFECSTRYLETALMLPKMSITRAREKLAQRGLIQYVKGNRNSKNPYYFLCGVTNVVTNMLPTCYQHVTNHKEETSPTPPKEENIYNNHQQQLCACTHEKSLEELEQALAGSAVWIESVRMALYRNYRMAVTDDQIKQKLPDFFIHLRSEGIEVKTEQDAKSHFRNWMAKVHEIENRKQNHGERIQESPRTAYVTKQEANEYAFSQFLKYRQARESGMADEVEKPF